MPSWAMFRGGCKSRLSAIARCCFLGREHWRTRSQAVAAELAEAEDRRARCEAQLKEARREIERLQAELRERDREAERAKSECPTWESLLEARVPGQTYPVALIVLSVNLARKIGLRRTVSVLNVFFDWLGISCRIPSYQTIRIWMQRIGLDRMQTAKRAKNGIWLVDHSMQVGKEKVLLVLRVRAVPPKRRPLCHDDVELICWQPGQQWKREDVLSVYQRLVAQYGHPLAVLTDGAVELREPAEMLKNKGQSPLVIRDLKHYLANRLETLLTRGSRWQEFLAHVGKTRSAVQQTEMSHFTPPRLKEKARFMNLEPILRWATMVLWHLTHSQSHARQGIEDHRMESKFGWLRAFESQINQWQTCQTVISKALTFFNENGVFRGSVRAFRRQVIRQIRDHLSRQLLENTVQFVRTVEKNLAKGQRLPISTEILESTFALYKQLEQQHSKGGFTSLLPVFGTLLKATTADEVLTCFARVKVADVHEWLKTNLPITQASRRQTAYREARGNKPKSATRMSVAA